MRVILQENIDNLGQIGDVVNVSAGYARNFLIPKRMVAVANEKNLDQLEHQKRALSKKRENARQDCEQLAKKLEDTSVTIARKVGANEKLFGSVDSKDIAEDLQASGFQVKKKDIQLDAPIKTLGVHPVEIRLHPEVNASVKVWVVEDKETQ